MERLTNFTFVLCAFLFTIALENQSFSINFTTLNNGNWNNTINVWSTDGGITPCGCAPTAITAGDNITINHNITTTSNININGSSIFTVNAGGALNGPHNVATSNTTIDFFGNVSINQYAQGINSVVIVRPGGVVTFGGNVSLASSFTVDGGVVNAAKTDVLATGTLTITNGSKYSVNSGNFTNNGTINIDAGCCIQTNGNFKNNASGSINGNGAINSGGNLNNAGTFSAGIAWCANGAGIGLPTAEDCATAVTTCSAITLPTEVIDFKAEIRGNSSVEISWSTASEREANYFEIQCSNDGSHWQHLGKINANGTTQEKQFYQLNDYDLRPGLKYYRLIQYDLNGNRNEYQTTSINIQFNNTPIAYPNPVNSGTNVRLSNLEPTTAQVNILSLSGQLISTIKYEVKDSYIAIETSNLQPGIYILRIEQLDSIKSLQLVVTE